MNSTINQAIQQYEKNKAKNVAKQKSPYKTKLAKCKDLKQLQYKKSNDCVAYLNHVLADSKIIANEILFKYRKKNKDYKVYDKLTVKAVKKVQKKAKLKKTGKIDKKTFKYIIKKL